MARINFGCALLLTKLITTEIINFIPTNFEQNFNIHPGSIKL